MQMLDFKDFFKVYFCKLKHFGSVLGNCFVSSAKQKKQFNNKHYNKTWYNKKVRFPVYESGVLHNVLIIMGNSLSS